MKKTLSFIVVLSFCFKSYAFDFTNYTPTLDYLYYSGKSEINSAYKIEISGNAIKITDNPQKLQGYDRYFRYDNLYGDVKGYFININGANNGAAIYNQGIIDNISGDFAGNTLTSNNAFGGAIYNTKNTENAGGLISNITGDFLINSAIGTQYAYGGAIYNRVGSGLGATITNIQGNFIGNNVKANGFAQGGAIFNQGTINNISGSFIGNNAISESNLALGGAIYTTKSMLFTADDQTIFFSDNYTQDQIKGKISNAIFINTNTADINLTFKAINNGSFIFDDQIEGGQVSNNDVSYTKQYTIKIIGDGTGEVVFNNSIINTSLIDINNSQLTLSGNPGMFGFGNYGHFIETVPDINLLNEASFNIANNYIENININSFSSLSENNYFHIDLNPETLTADTITATDINGVTKLIIHTLNDKDIRGNNILFATATGMGNENSFEVYRVYGSPYLFDIDFIDTTDKKWYLTMNSSTNPNYTQQPTPEEPDPEEPDIPGAEDPEDPNPENPESPNIENDKINVYPEVIGYIALQQVLLDQNYSIGNNLLNIKNNGIWIQPIFHEIKNNNIVDIKSSIKGVDFGLNKILQHNFSIGINGLLLSGNYNLNGNGNNVYSDTSTDINATSIVFGGYIKYTPDKLNFVLSLYGGKADTEILTEDGITTQAGANQLGVKAIAGYNFNLANLITLRPQISIGYTQISIEDIYDIVGKKATFEKLNHYYIESGINFNKEFKNIALYFEPSYIFTGNKGNIVNISNIASMNTITDLNLIKLKAGISLKLTNNLSVIADFKYITGKNYSNTGINAGISYSF